MIRLSNKENDAGIKLCGLLIFPQFQWDHHYVYLFILPRPIPKNVMFCMIVPSKMKHPVSVSLMGGGDHVIRPRRSAALLT
ncbi:hypothetical protein DO735_08820 [Salmonella enterica subsp. diarizonae]|uniref:Uncharacterized protein n=1 Tax=Salmonella diarizonae TaxID=59204 RepID=A0A5Y1YHF2_SALDZ|nr:hypothetical protein [Salmonella enterica subsp. diarizonae]EAN8505453.1 hypothetical protein [Salmonella enterica]EAS4984887.1 hypothetical protein [Salmonella enterica]EBI4323587.1 hypothetical protein [Salmonella enterica]ECC3917575.1 hypothetical protein [Salmonella enterica subsp. diarizonae]